MSYLLDTVVLSELRKTPDRRNPHLVRWFGTISSEDVFVSVLTIYEIERGVERQRTQDPAFAAKLAIWLDAALNIYEGRVLPISVPIARRWARLSGRIGHAGLDLAIAATAIQHGLRVATRNISDFVPTEVPTVNPFAPID